MGESRDVGVPGAQVYPGPGCTLDSGAPGVLVCPGHGYTLDPGYGLCYAVVLTSVFRAGFRPDSSRATLKIGSPAGRRPVEEPILRLSRLDSGRQDRFPARKHYCGTWGPRSPPDLLGNQVYVFPGIPETLVYQGPGFSRDTEPSLYIVLVASGLL